MYDNNKIAVFTNGSWTYGGTKKMSDSELHEAMKDPEYLFCIGVDEPLHIKDKLLGIEKEIDKMKKREQAFEKARPIIAGVLERYRHINNYGMRVMGLFSVKDIIKDR